jgi:hypothetical protein
MMSARLQTTLLATLLLAACQHKMETTRMTAVHGDLSTLPELLLTTSGRKITTVDEWRTIRRPEILELFRQNVYGRNAVDRPEQLSFEVKRTDPSAMQGKATLKEVVITYGGPHGTATLPVTLFVPNKRSGRVPAFVYIHIGDRKRIDPARSEKHGNWPAEEIIERGYATAAYQVDDLAPNLRPPSKVEPPEDPTSNVLSVFEKAGEPRAADAWGTIGVWAWGASLVMDYLETDADIDARRVAVIGHSRAGKTALWAGAQDQRFMLVISNNSGSTGAALARGKSGVKAETIADINRGFPRWFCENYKNFNGKEAQLPVDQHMLLALVAPRLLYVASAHEDVWAHPESEFAAAKLAQPAWQLHNLPTMHATELPPLNVPLHDAPTGYHVRPGKHGLTEEDWRYYLDFADRHLKQRAAR